MFSATRLNVFICIALGLASNAAPAGLGSTTDLAANADIGELADLDLTGTVGTSPNIDIPDIASLVSSLGFAANAGADTTVTRRQILENIFGQGSDLLNEFGLGGLSGGASASTDSTTDASGLGVGSLLGSGLGGSSSFRARSEVEKRQILENIIGQGTDLVNGLGLGGLSGGLSGGASTSAGTTTNGTSTDASASGIGSLLGPASGLGSFGGSSSTGLGTSFGLRSEEKRQILESIFGQGSDLLNEFGLGGLSGGASASTGTSTDASGLGLGGSSSSSFGSSFGARSEVGTRQILENIIGQGTGLVNEFGLGGLGGGLSGGASTSAGTTANGTSADTSAGGFGNLLSSGLTGFGGLSGSSSTGLGTSFGLRSEEKREILESIFGQGSDLINEFGVGSLTGGALASTGATIDTSASGLGSVLPTA